MSTENSLRQARMALNMSLSEAADKVGTVPSTFSAWESGRIFPNTAWNKISELFGSEALNSFRVDTTGPEWGYYHHLVSQNIASSYKRLKPLIDGRFLFGLSQARVAMALNVSVLTYARWEKGETVPHPRYQELMSALWGPFTLPKHKPRRPNPHENISDEL